MVDRSRKFAFKRVSELELSYTTLGDLLDEVRRMIDFYGADARVDTYQNDYEETIYHGGIFARVEETDAEMAKRIGQEERWEKYREEQDAKEFARLKAKFGE